jgi:hypothetical protein
MDFRISNLSPQGGHRLAIAYLSCGDLSVTPALAIRDLRANGSEYVWRASGGWMIQALRRLHEPVSDSSLRIALALAVVALSLMLWAIIWQANIIVYQRDLIRVMWNTQFGGLK